MNQPSWKSPTGSRLKLEALEARDVPAIIGTLDPSFGVAGKTTIDFGFGDERASAVAIAPDGKIVVVGPDGAGNFGVARFLPNGKADATFSGDGKASFDFGGTIDVANGVVVQPDGKIVVVGATNAAGNNDMAVLRVNVDGSADTTFGINGRTTIAYDIGGAKDDQATAVALPGAGVNAAGNIIVVGFDQFAATDYDMAVVQLLPDGKLDTNFGLGFNGGKDFFNFDIGGGFQDKAYAVTIQNNSTIVVAGSAQITATDFDFAIVRVNLSGDFDLAFNKTGKLTIPFGTGAAGVASEDKATSLAIQPDGNIIVGGYTQVAGGSNFDFAIARVVGADGTLDTSFDGDGKKTIAFDSGGAVDDRVTGVQVQPDGKIVIAGYAQTSATGYDFETVRLISADGSYDPTFGSAGKLAIDFGGADKAAAVALGANGRIVVAGTTGIVGNFAVARIIGTVEEPQSVVVGGAVNGTAVTYRPNLSTGKLTAFGTSSGADSAAGVNVRVAVGDVNGDGFPDSILVTGPGVPIRVTLVNGQDGVSVLADAFDPFGGDFLGGGFVAAGDFDNDGRAEIVVTPDQGGGPRVVIFDLATDGTIVQRANFFGIDDPGFRGGARAGVGDVNADGIADLAVAAGFQGGPRVALYNGRSIFSSRPIRLVGDFFVFDPGLRNGVYVSIGDVNGDGYGDLVFGAGPGGGPRVLIASGQKLLTSGASAAVSFPLDNFFMSGHEAERGGARVSTADLDGDTRADVIVATGEGTPSTVRVYLGRLLNGSEPKSFQELDPFSSLSLLDGTFVG